jgi:hypothetical protein
MNGGEMRDSLVISPPRGPIGAAEVIAFLSMRVSTFIISDKMIFID